MTTKLNTGFWNQLTFWPGGHMVKKGHNHPLTHPELWKLPDTHEAEALWKRFEFQWNKQIEIAKRSPEKKQPSILKAVVGTFWKEYLLAVFFQLVYGICSFVIPLVLPYMLEYVADPSIEYWWGLVYLAIIAVVTPIGSFFYYNALYMSNIIGIQVRSTLIQLVYRKVLRLGPSRTSNSGQTVNLVANDTQFFSDTLSTFSNGLTAPFQIIIATGLISRHVGIYCLIAPAVFFFLLPVATWLGKRFGRFRMGIQAFADKRLKLTGELISGIRIVKYYAWEDAFKKNINVARAGELAVVKSLGLNRAVLIFIMSNTTTVIIALLFLFYGLYGPNDLTASRAFATLSFVNLLRMPFFLLPFTITLIMQYTATFQRIGAFMSRVEVDSEPHASEKTGHGEVEIKDGVFKFDTESEATGLKNINFKVGNGELVMVVGSVGSGKSTLAGVVLGEIAQTQGTRSVKGSIAYVAQEAWIVNATLRDNVLFGSDFDEDKYNKVIHAAALGPDLQQLPNGDKTEIGERGINLSGGQKQRVSIARALYADRDIVVLDDPFSAVDSHVGKHLFEHALTGYLKGKTILFVTNQLQYLPFADNIVVLQEGQQVAFGNFKDLMVNSEYFKNMMTKFGDIDENRSKTEETQPEEKKKVKESKPEAKKPVLTAKPTSGGLTKLEEKSTGLVSIKVYWYYVKAGGAALFLIIIGCFLASVGANIGSSWWLTQWTAEATTNPKGIKTTYYVGIYIAFLVGQGIGSFFAFLLFTYFSYYASKILHETLLSKLLRAPTAFYDITPIGRIINRFAKELGMIDALLPMQLSQYLNAIISLFGVFAAMIFGSAYVVLAIVPVCGFYVWFQQYYRHTSIELQRLEALSRAPILSHLSETLNGTTSIRAYGVQSKFVNTNQTRIDYNTTELFTLRYCAQFFGLRLDWAGTVLVIVTILSIVLSRINDPSSVDIGFAGLAMTYISGLTFVLSNLNNMAVETETRMNSVERVKEYENLAQEAPEVIEENRPPANWPAEGKIEFKDYCLRYREGELVLKHINVNIDAEDKIGIVGRTGAGKSTLMQALFRMVEPAEGTIFIDGVDITKIGLKDLRSRLSIIPQEPTLFIGTIRYNVDPFGEHEDSELWDVLQMVELKKVISEFPNKLDELVAEGGSNLSVGQRQLICMARALLRKSKVLLMDEATASVDLNTDSMIQTMVRKHFQQGTVLTIAHRLNTIMDSTKIMLLEKGELAEFAKPTQLLKDSDSYFSKMVDATGPISANYLRKIAFGELDLLSSLDKDPTATAVEAPKEEEPIKEKKQKKEKKHKKQKKERKESKANLDLVITNETADVDLKVTEPENEEKEE